MHYLAPNYIGPNHLNHMDIANRNLSIPNALFGNDENILLPYLMAHMYIYKKVPIICSRKKHTACINMTI